MRTELGLAARALQEEDEPTGYLDGDLSAQVLLDEGEREVHPGGDARGGPDVAVADENRVRVHGEFGVLAGELGGVRPVGGYGATLEQAGPCEQEGAGADRGDPSRAAGGAPDPADQGSVLLRPADARPAGDHEGVDRAAAMRRGHLRRQRVAAANRDRIR